MIRSVLVLSLLLTIGAPAAEPRVLLPVDEAAKDPSFFIFRARLQEAVARRDVPHVLSILSPKVLNSFGGNGGIEEFKKMWKPEKADSALWSTLAHMLSLGGKFLEDRSFEAPYVSAAWPESADAFDYGAIIGENVRVREKPDKESAVLARLSFALVRAIEFAPDKTENSWTKIQLDDGRTGYVSAQFVGHAVDWRAIFEKHDGQWRMSVLVAGD